MIKSMAVCDRCAMVIANGRDGVAVEGNIYALEDAPENGMKGGGLVGNAFSEDGKVSHIYHYHKTCLVRILDGHDQVALRSKDSK